MFSIAWTETSTFLSPIQALWLRCVDWHHDASRKSRRPTFLVEFSPADVDVLNHDWSRTRVNNVDDNPLGIRRGSDVLHDFC